MMKLKISSSMKGRIITLKKEVLVYKAVRGAIAQLLLPVGTKISIPSNYSEKKGRTKAKLRADQAIVVAIIPANPPQYRTRRNFYTDISDVNDKYSSKWDQRFFYQMGERVTSSRFSTYSTTACQAGIHFFVNLKDAEGWL